MKKVLFSFLSLLFVSYTAVKAQEASKAGGKTTTTTTVSVTQDDKVKIKSEELPDAVRTTIKGDEYKNWLVGNVYHSKSTDQYEVELKNGAETKTVKFGKDGKVIQ